MSPKTTNGQEDQPHEEVLKKLEIVICANDRTDHVGAEFNARLKTLRAPVSQRVADFFRKVDELETWLPVIQNIVWNAFSDAYQMGFKLGRSVEKHVSSPFPE
jgi:hypothetical protein